MKKRIVSFLLTLALLIPAGGFASANNTKLIALSFDDGPNAACTAELLDGLAARDVKATFFLVGRNASYYPELAAREAAEGHQVANHTWSHAWLTELSGEQAKGEASAGAAEIRKATGRAGPFYLRVPYGAVNDAVKSSVGAPIILWSIDPGSGSMNASEASMAATLLNTAFDGGIIILHDSSQKNVNVALYGIDQLRAQGYEFVTVEELFRLRGVTRRDGGVYYSAPASAAEQSFDESQLSAHWAAADIQAVENARIMSGDGGAFRPNAWLTRAQAAEILWRMAGSPTAAASEADSDSDSGSDSGFGAPAPTLPVPAGSAVTFLTQRTAPVPPAAPKVDFADVSADAWYAQAVSWAHESGFLKGNAGCFYPEQYITKEQLYTMLARYRRHQLYAAPQTASPAVYRDDCRISAWAGESVALFRNAGFSSKNDPQIFRPKDFASRAEAAELVAWMLRNVP